MIYADTSALVKLVVHEPESSEVHQLATSGTVLVSSDLARTELLRAARRIAPAAVGAARDVLARLVLLRATSAIFDAAAVLEPNTLRSLDAVHLASALTLGDELEGVLTYDERLGDAARALGLTVLAPA
ncbi:type II toxin-antitoxin system VapC family toxin [Branchiibius sp. NY16-3462-2]|uniref:type II toxin-antitoxin system VapC family toxin n=1 Tax=Branchiibius sp. NY16-3462-2 TaxID=1807500 RepID=UPI00079BE009|nr:type II toxin-antitoxin system VapC family toxin [Branchiibius sp. NY16-3462-2]KYH43179.1 twitching motility protein PilT [Branchiibius sp. NY16-3462-2]